MAAVASPSSRNQTLSSSCSFSYPFASYTSGNFAPEPPLRPHTLLLLIWPPSAFFFHLYATVSNIVIREILPGATTKLPRTTLHGYKEVQLEPTSSWALLRKDFAAPSKYTAIQFRVLHKLKTLASGSSKSAMYHLTQMTSSGFGGIAFGLLNFSSNSRAGSSSSPNNEVVSYGNGKGA
ncbi:hypothetical protein AHAS_Ahas01G0140900 [Arachis hypogaea]